MAVNKYDTGAITREATDWFLANRGEGGASSGVELAKVLDALADTTEKLADEVFWFYRGRVLPADLPDYDRGWKEQTLTIPEVVQLWRWQYRLQWYLDALSDVEEIRMAMTDPEVAREEIWEPLYFGLFYPEVWPEDVIERGFMPGFDFSIQHVSDFAEPWRIANAVGVGVEFDEKFWEASEVWKYIKAEAKARIEETVEVIKTVVDEGLDIFGIDLTAIAVVGGVAVVGLGGLAVLLASRR